MELYDMEKQEWRGNFEERGESWRSVRVYRCKICHTKTNKWHMGGWPGKGPRLLCPRDEYEEHDELELILEKYREFESLLELCSSVDQKRVQDLKESHLLVELLKKRVEKFRGKFSGRVDDVEGVSVDAEVRDYYPSTRYGGEKDSLA